MHPSSEGLFAGRFRIEGKLGEGAYGKVYAAMQVDLGRRVALKVLHPDVVLRESAVERFLREAQVVQSLSHPHIVRLFDHGRTEDGLPFIVYELLEGRSLEAALQQSGPMRPERAAWIGVQMLRALLEAHARGVVHRDMKPANVFLCDYPGETDFVKVVDFGVAAIANQTGPELTREGASVGTPAYMAPEQMLGGAVDGRSDVYAVGLVLAEMLTGHRVFLGESAIAVGLQQISDAPVPLGEGVRGSSLGGVIARAVEKTPSRRFSADEFLRALEAVVDNRSFSLPPLPAPRAAAAPRKVNALVALVALLGFTGLALAGLALWIGFDGPPVRTPTRAVDVPAEAERASADGAQVEDVAKGPDEIFGELERRRFKGVTVAHLRKSIIANGWLLGTQNVMTPSPTLKVYAMNFTKQDRTLSVMASCKLGEDPAGGTIADGCFAIETCVESSPCTLTFFSHVSGTSNADDAKVEFQRAFATEPH